MTEEKIREIKKMLRQGVPDGEIRETLTEEGYTKDEIDTVFKPHHYDMRSWYLFFGIIVCLAGLYFLFTKRSLLILSLGILLFVAYLYEIKRLNDLNKFK